jgi:hypothetical protein
MSDFDALMRPFEPFLDRRWKRRLWGVLLAGAPLVLAAGFWIHGQHFRQPGFRMLIDRERAVEIARETARAHGIETADWRERVRFEIRPATMAYFRAQDIGEQFRVRRFLPEAVAEVLLAQPAQGLWVRAEVGPRGFVTNFRAGGRGMRAPAEPGAEEVSRAAAEREIREWLGGMAVRFLREPETSVAADGEVAGVRRYTWRLEPRNAPQVELVLRVDVMGDRVVGRSVEPVFAPAFLEEKISKPSAAADTLYALRLLVMVFLVVYAGYRYARRSMEREAPHGRALLLLAVFVAARLALGLADPDSLGVRFDAPQMTAVATAIGWAVLALSSMLIGAVLGMAYGAGEGELREGWPGKITSLDAALTGRIFSSNIGVAVVAGLVWSAWWFFAVVAARAALDLPVTEQALNAIGFTLARWPLAVLYIETPLEAVALSVFVLLAPLVFLRRHVRWTAVRVAALAAVALLLAHEGRGVDALTPAAWVEAGALAGAVVLAFLTFDYLAAVMAAATLKLLLEICALMAVPYWSERLDAVSVVAVVLMLPLAAAAWAGRRLRDAEVQPAHAARLAERLEMEAELAAAHEAQRMLLPAAPPDVPGVVLAAVCRAAREASGDFYDFYRRADGRLCVVVGSGSGGLAAALAIGLAKGFLLHENVAGASLADALLRMEKQLGGVLRRCPATLSVGMALLDPRSGALELARAGAWPRIFVRRREQIAFEPALPLWTAGIAIDVYRTKLDRGDAVLICTQGLCGLVGSEEWSAPEALLSALPSDEPPPLQSWLERTVETMRASRGASAQGDLTAVLLCVCSSAAEREEAA